MVDIIDRNVIYIQILNFKSQQVVAYPDHIFKRSARTREKESFSWESH